MSAEDDQNTQQSTKIVKGYMGGFVLQMFTLRLSTKTAAGGGLNIYPVDAYSEQLSAIQEPAWWQWKQAGIVFPRTHEESRAKVVTEDANDKKDWQDGYCLSGIMTNPRYCAWYQPLYRDELCPHKTHSMTSTMRKSLTDVLGKVPQRIQRRPHLVTELCDIKRIGGVEDFKTLIENKNSGNTQVSTRNVARNLSWVSVI